MPIVLHMQNLSQRYILNLMPGFDLIVWPVQWLTYKQKGWHSTPRDYIKKKTMFVSRKQSPDQ